MSCNHFIHSAAGTGKTTKIVSLATKLAVRYHKRVVITTYTQENTIEIYDKVIAKIGYIPSNIFILTWYTFLLNDFVRPYQNLFGINHRINDVMFVNQKSAPYTKKTALTHYISNNIVIRFLNLLMSAIKPIITVLSIELYNVMITFLLMKHKIYLDMILN